jgi:DNA-binding winged helix-turn-helix (wHTH) protein
MHDPAVSACHVAFGPFALDLRSGELRKGPVRLRVGVQSIEILKALLEQPGELVTRDQLRERLWPSDTFVDFEHGLNAAIRRLREALGDSADTPKYIETLPRRGDRFVASLERPPAIVPVAVTPPRSEASDDRNVWRRSWGQRNLLVVTALVLAVGFGVYIARRSHESPPTDSLVSLSSIPVTRLQGFEVEPSLSPQGNQVAFAWDGEAGENFDIYVKQLDSEGGSVRLTTNVAEDRFPSWSPDGSQIAFLRVTRAGAADAIMIRRWGDPNGR